MNVSLIPELQKWINEKVKSGLYHSSSEIIREGLRLLIRHEEQRQAMIKDLRSKILTGVKQSDLKKSREFTKDIINKIKQNARKDMGV